MVLGELGALAAGSVWGWLAVLFVAPSQRPVATGSAMLAASAAFAFEVTLFVDELGTVLFAGAALVGFIVHVVWRRLLRRRLESHHGGP
jgi:hypothetical protein